MSSHALHNNSLSIDLDALRAIDEILDAKPMSNGLTATKKRAFEYDDGYKHPSMKRPCIREEPWESDLGVLDCESLEFLSALLPAAHRDSVSHGCCDGSGGHGNEREHLAAGHDHHVGAKVVMPTLPLLDFNQIEKGPYDAYETSELFFESLLEGVTPQIQSDASSFRWSNASDASSEPKADDITSLTESDRAVFEQYLAVMNNLPFPAGTEQACIFCPQKRYYRRHDICLHIKTEHLLERRFECNICCTRFKRKGHLQGHIAMVHTKNSEAYMCKWCNKSFCSDSSKRKHIRSVHKTDSYD